MGRGLGGGRAEPKQKFNQIYKIVGFVILVIILMVAVPVYYHVRQAPPVEYPCDVDLSVPLFNPKTYRNGTVENDGQVYPSGYHFEVNGTIRGCLCKLKPCIRKCCGRGEYMEKAPGQPARCEKNPDPSPFDNFTLPVYHRPGTFAEINQDHFKILYGDVCRHGKFMLTPDTRPDDQYFLLVDGTIQLGENFIDASGYCLESLNGSAEIRTMMCFPDQDEDPETKAMFTVYPIGMIISIPFMVVTFLVYSILPELRNIHGISLMCHSAVLLTAYLFLSIIQISRDGLNPTLCTVFAFIVQFSFLATFFWLNVMSFDIWLVLSSVMPARDRKRKTFILYSLYAWGVPAIIVAISVAMDTIPGIPDSYIKPNFGQLKCWFADKEGQLLYFYLPIAVVVILNIIMFVSTAFVLCNRNSALNNENSRTTRQNKDRFKLYLKLFIIMGVNWVMELVSFFVGGPKSLWFVTDVGNTLQGVLIFVIFICKPNVLRLLNEKLCPQWKFFKDNSSSRSKVSSTRTNSTTVSKAVSENEDIHVLKPIARANQSETDE